jgi:hypothetical protein
LSAPVKIRRAPQARDQRNKGLLRCKALHGDARALDLLVKLAQQFNSDAAEGAPAQTLDAEDQAILDAYVAARAPAPPTPATTDSLEDRVSEADASGSKKESK